MDSIAESLNKQGVEDIEETIAKMQPDAELVYYLYNSIANMYFWQSEDKKAAQYFKKCLEYSPEHYNAYYNMAHSYHKLKDYRNEMKCFETFLKYSTEDDNSENKQYARECIQ